ncbi:hypothetical protein LTR36_008536 [Oleoguttula mirabilis]|uniref:RNase III domain-containing protein n=1 Tax=Oleoguttula mirabilis TaxID=1507867 RepID=A0AAV9JSX5_9PEZI|nr:hypothetical protein LTR36_008536 [Oleoguttula mirabilis]
MATTQFSAARTHIELLIQYNFTNPLLLEEALLATPSMVGTSFLTEFNKRLAIVGNGAIKLLVTNDCYLAGMPKGQADLRRQAVESNSKLAKLGRAKGIDLFIVKGGGTTVSSIIMVASAVEAIFGAVFVDSKEDYGATKRAMVAFGLLED